MRSRVSPRHRAAALAALLSAAGAVPAATLTVTTTSDADAADGACSLREAIIAINTGANRHDCTGSSYGSNDTIAFAIPGAGVHTIAMGDDFDEIVKPVTIDGLTQPGAGCDAWPPTLLVELDGQGVAFRGLMLDPGSGGSLVRGLVIGGMSNAGDNFSAGIQLRSDGNRVECNYIGLRADGSTANPNRRGVDINSAHENVVGTDGVLPALGRRNLISGNVFSGVNTRGASPSRNVVAGNYIGVDASGMAARSNGVGVAINGQSISPPAVDNVIGYNGVGSPEFARNIISGNNTGSSGSAGISMTVGAQRTRIAGNYIGLSADGTQAVPNFVGFDIGSNASVRDNLIGFPSAQPLAVSGNVISGNQFAGILLNGFNGTDRTFVVGNLVGTYPNGAAGLPNGSVGISLYGGTRALLNGNVVSGHTTGIRLLGASGQAMPTLLNGEALPTGGDPLDSSGNCVTDNDFGFNASTNGSSAATAVFENNWWGAANGPGAVGGGNGDLVSGLVDFDPFLATAPTGCAVTPLADLRVTVSGVPDPLRAGTAFTASVVVSNAGPDAAANASLRVALPAGAAVEPPPGCSVTDNELECALGSVAVGGPDEEIVAELPFEVPADAAGSLSLTVSVTSTTLDPAAGNNSVIVARDILREADVAVTLENADDALVEGVATRYTMRVSNAGPASVAGYVLALDAAPGLSGMSWSCSASAGASCPANGTGTIDAVLALPAGSEATFLVDAMVTGPGPVAVEANGTMPDGTSDTEPGNDSDVLALDVGRSHDLSVRVETDALEVRAGQWLAFRVVAANDGPSHAADALVELLPPEGASELLWSCSAADGASCGAAGAGVLEETVQLPAGGSVLFEASVRVAEVEGLSLSALVVEPADGTDPDGGDNSDTLALVVLPPLPDQVFGDGFEVE